MDEGQWRNENGSATRGKGAGEQEVKELMDGRQRHHRRWRCDNQPGRMRADCGRTATASIESRRQMRAAAGEGGDLKVDDVTKVGGRRQRLCTRGRHERTDEVRSAGGGRRMM